MQGRTFRIRDATGHSQACTKICCDRVTGKGAKEHKSHARDVAIKANVKDPRALKSRISGMACQARLGGHIQWGKTTWN